MNPSHGRTYTLTDRNGDSSDYFRLIGDLADHCLTIIPGEEILRDRVRAAASRRLISSCAVRKRSGMERVVQTLEEHLSPFLTGIDEHLSHLSLPDRMDRTLRMKRKQYLLSMLEIELTNRLNTERFGRASWRMALIAHCLKDFRDNCRSLPGKVEEKCVRCNEECFIGLSSGVTEKFGVHQYISVSMDHKRLFRGLKKEHPDIGVLGIACVPELVTGLRLCEEIGIPAIGVPLDANRCSRWFERCLETTFNLEEMERFLG